MTALAWAVALVTAVAAGVAVARAAHWREVARRAPGPVDEAPAPAEDVPAPAEEVAAAPAGTDGDVRLLERLRDVVDGLEQGVVLQDATGAELYRNSAARSLAEARDGRALVAAAIDELLAEARQGRRVRRVVELFGPPAEAFVVTAAPFPGYGAADGDRPAGGEVAPPEGAVAVVEDRSLQRRTETVRRDFVANISHELKTPVGALGLLAETLRDEVEVEDADREAVGRLADRMISEADRAASTIDDLLELSRIEFGDEADFTRVTLAEVVGEATARLASAAEHAGITLLTDVPGDLAVVGDRRQLVSAVYNLVDNAVKYSPAGSEVHVSAGADGGRVSVVVEDHGIGVPRRDLDRIFERFYRVDRARSRSTGGTGLGLAIVRHVASNHGGEVLVSSVEGVGSVFTLVIPAAGNGDDGVLPALQPAVAR